MGMPFRSYQDIESGRSPVRPGHLRAAEMAAITIAQESSERAQALPLHLKDMILSVAKTLDR